MKHVTCTLGSLPTVSDNLEVKYCNYFYFIKFVKENFGAILFGFYAHLSCVLVCLMQSMVCFVDS